MFSFLRMSYSLRCVMSFSLFSLLLDLFSTTSDEGHVRREGDICGNCWWNAITNAIFRKWSWLEVQLTLPGSIRYVQDIGDDVWRRSYFALSVSAPADHAPKSTVPWHTMIQYGVCCIGKKSSRVSISPCMGSMSSVSGLGKQKKPVTIIDTRLMWRARWSENHWQKYLFPVTGLNLVRDMD